MSRRAYQLEAGPSASNKTGNTSTPSNRIEDATAIQDKAQNDLREATADYQRPKPKLLLQKEENNTTLDGELMLGLG